MGGAWRSRLIAVPSRPGLRPTPDRVRETLFNWLGQDLAGMQCLDLFAGSGALGFEAASRGAARVVMVECDRSALAALRATRTALNAAQVEIVAGDASAFLAASNERFDLVFLDPPFRQMRCRPCSRRCRRASRQARGSTSRPPPRCPCRRPGANCDASAPASKLSATAMERR